MNTVTSPDTCFDSCASHFRTPLPPALRAEATGMSWSIFTETYAPATGPIRLGAWTASPTRHDLLECQATIASGNTIASLTATATGSIAALSDMLYRLGSGVEIISLHQYPHAGGIATFLLCERDERRSWSMGNGPTGEESALGALIAAANRLVLR